MTAALAAREAGAEVLVLERDAKPAGSTALSTGLIPAAATRFQRALGIEDSPELLAADIWRKAKGATDRAIVDTVAHARARRSNGSPTATGSNSGSSRDSCTRDTRCCACTGRPIAPGRSSRAALLASAGGLGIDIMANAAATGLYAQRDGRVVAVRFSRPDGTTETVGCDALVLACCGFGGDKDMVRQHIPEIADAEFWGHVGNKGDAIKWGLALGAAVADLGSYQGHGAVATPYGNPVNWGLLTNGGYQVNALGRRFSNEVRGYSEQAVEVIAQPGRVAWDIFDEVRERPILGFTDYREIQSLGGIRKAPTLQALAALVSLPPDALERTNAEVDALRAGGGEDRWGRNFRGTGPLAPPFCAIKVTGALFHTQGGLVIDACGPRAARGPDAVAESLRGRRRGARALGSVELGLFFRRRPVDRNDARSDRRRKRGRSARGPEPRASTSGSSRFLPARLQRRASRAAWRAWAPGAWDSTRGCA